MWQNYWPIYERSEKEIVELTFSIFLCNAHLSVYSIKMADLLIRIGSECENIAKSVAKTRDFQSSNGKQIEDLNFPGLGDLLCSHISFNTKEVDIIWYYNDLSCKSIVPFSTWNTTGSLNPKWFKAYNEVKHDRDVTFHQANFENILNGLAALFILNLWLRKEDIEQEWGWIEFAQKRIRSYSSFFTPEKFLVLSKTGGTSKGLTLQES